MVKEVICGRDQIADQKWGTKRATGRGLSEVDLEAPGDQELASVFKNNKSKTKFKQQKILNKTV